MNKQHVWRNAHLFDFSEELVGLKQGAMLAVDGVIEWVGHQDKLPKTSSDAVIFDCQGMVLMPGLIDCHTHVVYAGNRSGEWEARLQGQAYEDIHRQGGGIHATVRATREANFDQLFASSAKRLSAMIAQGVTTVEIKSGYGLDLATERKMLLVAKALGEHFDVNIQKTFLGAHTLATEFESTGQYMQHVIEDMLPALAQENLIDCVDVFTESIAFSLEDTRRLFEACQAMGLHVKCHAEQLTAMGASSLAASYKALSADHIEHITEDDVLAMKASGTVAVLLPGAFYFLKETQKPPIELLRKHQVPIAVATDCNPGTSPTNSLPLMLNMACTFFGLTPHEALTGATSSAAKALNLSRVGALKPGMLANCSLWDIEHPRDIVYQFGTSLCHASYSKGNQIYGK